jgi:hypothetical protein
MLKVDPSIAQCKVRRLVWNVLRKCVCRKVVGLMDVGAGHLNRGDEDFTDTRS